MTNEKMLTIVVPVHNRADIVSRTLDTIIAQDGIHEAELILVDNNSTDTTADVLHAFADQAGRMGIDVRVLSEMHPGASATRNCGIRATTTPWLMHFDSDDIMHPGLLRHVLSAIHATDADVIGWEIEQQIPSGAMRKGRFDDRHILWSHLVHGAMSTQRYAVRTDIARHAGMWDAGVRGWNDYEFGLRILLEKPRVVKLPGGPWVTTLFTPESITGYGFSSDPAKWEHPLDLCRQHLVDAGLSPRMIDVRRAILAGEYAREHRHDLARTLRKAALAEIPKKRERAVWRALYRWQRHIGRGTALVSTLFYKKG